MVNKNMSNCWKEVFDETYIIQKEIKKFIEDYDYSTNENVKRTDNAVCTFFVEHLEKAKNIIQEIIDLTFELQKENKIIEILDDMQDNIENIIADIESRSLRWDNLSKDRLKKIVLRDSFIIIGVQQLLMHLETLKSHFFNMQKEKSKFEYNKKLEDFIHEAEEIKKEIDNIDKLFREREELHVPK